MNIEVGKFYRTRRGNKVRIYATDGGGGYPIHGAMLFDLLDDAWTSEAWTLSGKYSNRNIEHPHDIVAEWSEPCPVDWSDMPAWANWVVMESNGRMSWSQDEPRKCGADWSAGLSGHIPREYIKRKPTAPWNECKWQRPS